MVYVQSRGARRRVPLAQPVYAPSGYPPVALPTSGAPAAYAPTQAYRRPPRRQFAVNRRDAATRMLSGLAQRLARLGVYPDINGVFYSDHNHPSIFHPNKRHEAKMLEHQWNQAEAILHPELLPGIETALGQPAMMQQPAMVQQQVPVAMPMMPVAMNNYGLM